ncbi:YrhB domain-containing protein [Pelagibius marinus]|uniref:YrhB domain-containing protein n=1 Tax=Pelagibius marinus TaxID=2762760 RepID=UPI001872A11E|nr:YrhB domain-containing protein [Pelagibius marinus]
MIDYEEAREIVEQHLAETATGTPKLVLLDDETMEEDFGWVFFYQSEEYLRSGSFADQLAGNAPIIVSKVDGSLHVTGTAHPVEVYIESFRRSGSPHG